MTYTDAQALKFSLLAEGAVLSDRAAAALNDIVDGGALSPADYASTTGLIVRLDREVWVNMPIERYNPNFVSTSTMVFDHGDDGFFVHGPSASASAEFWPPPLYHGTTGSNGLPINNYVFTHGDRARLSPTIGCAMECTFCNIPYDDAYAGTKPIDAMLEAVSRAMTDPRQPARHLLISGGTPGPPHVAALRDIYERVIAGLPGVDVDIMMVPVDGLFDLPRLDALGLNEISINLELWSEDLARTVMRHKHRQGRQHYLDFLADAADVLGGHRVRSMLMVGIEPLESTLEGVEAIAARGCVPVLSPFRPDPATPMAGERPPDAQLLREAHERAADIADRHGVSLGPSCVPCSHNTLDFGAASRSDHTHSHDPVLVSGRS